MADHRKAEKGYLRNDNEYMHRMRKRILIIYVVILAAGALYTLLIFRTGFGIPCIFNRVTGLLCPGCGTSRMALSVMRLDFASAFRYNPVAFVTVPAWIVISLCCFTGYPDVLCREKNILRILYVNIALYAVFCVVRNMPWYGFGF